MKKQNECLNFFKGLACIFVVSLHIRFPYANIDGLVQCIARFAVPLFFMISGYYCFYEDERSYINKLPKKIIHVGKICIVAFAFWIIVQYVVCLLGSESHNILELTKSIFSLSSIIRLIFLNDDPVISILWFLLALLYCYLVYFICALMRITQILPMLIVPCLIMHFCMGNIGSGMLGLTIDVEYYRNAWFMGIPLFMIGHEIRNKQDSIIRKISSNNAMSIMIFGVILSIIEWKIVGGRQQMYIGSILVSIGIILYSVWNSQRKLSGFLAYVGEKCSLYVYVIHISVGIMIDKVAKVTGWISNPVYLCLKSTCVILVSILISVAIVEMINWIKQLKVYTQEIN